MFTISNRKIVNREGKMFLWPFLKSFWLRLPQRFTIRFGGREGGGVNSQKLFRNRKFTIYDFFDLRFLRMSLT
jgi:hypothetical protein